MVEMPIVQPANCLQARLARRLITGALALLAVGGALTLFIDYRLSSQRERQVHLELVAAVMAPAANILLSRDAAAAQALTRGLGQIRPITSVRLTGNDHFEYIYHRSDDTANVKQSEEVFPIHASTEDPRVIGELAIALDQSELSRRLMLNTLPHLSILFVITLLASFLLYVVIKRLGIDHAHAADSTLAHSGNVLRHGVQTEATESSPTSAQFDLKAPDTEFGIFTLNAKGSLLAANQRLLDLIFEHQSPSQSSLAAEFIASVFIHPDLVWALIEESHYANHAAAAELMLKQQSGIHLLVHCLVMARQDELGNLLRVDGVLTSLARQNMSPGNRPDSSLVDLLTGLVNHRHAYTVLDRSVRHISEARGSLGLILLEIEDWSRIVEEHGALASDQLVIACANTLRARIRRSADLVARVDSARFMVMLYETGNDADFSSRIADELQALLQEPIQMPNAGPRITLQILTGVARLPDDGITRRALLRVAERKLYSPSRSG